jgi:gluconolactonase
MAHTAHDPAFERLIDLHAPVRQICSGFTFTEGPVWHSAEQALYFSDMPADVRRRWDRNGVREVMRPSNKANGLALDAELNLLACEHATSAVARFRPDGRREVLASHFEGRELNSPNDLCVHSSGAIYFTDPWYGRMPHYGVERPRQLGFQGVYRLAPNHGAGAEPQLLVERYLFSQPNGLCFSPCERLLYVNDTEQANIRVFDVAEDGSLRQVRIFASGIRESLNPGVPDGMKCDAEGNVWVTGPGGLWVFRPDGKHIGRVAIPEQAANLAWGGEDWRTLFVCASTSVYAVVTKVGPRNEPHMRAAASRTPRASEPLRLDARRCALIIQDMQNDVVMEGGAFASTGAAQHCREQNAIANIARLAERCRSLGIPVIHVWFVVPPGGKGMTLNAPLFEGVVDHNAMVRGSWGAAPVPGLEPRPGDHIVEKNRMSAWEGTMLETILKAEGRDIVIETGAWTNMSIEHTARTGADKGYVMIIPEDGCSTMNADWHRASINYALQNVALVTTTDAVIAALG